MRPLPVSSFDFLLRDFRPYFSSVIFTAVVALATSQLGCSILVGKVKPVEEKASPTTLFRGDSLDSNWVPLQMESSAPDEGDIPDASWQSKKTAAIISINSACRQGIDEERDIRAITQHLLSAWRSLKVERQQEIIVSGQTALETTAQGFYLDQNRKFQIIVVKTPHCVYDLLYLAPPVSFKEELSVFQKFRDNLNLK